MPWLRLWRKSPNLFRHRLGDFLGTHIRLWQVNRLGPRLLPPIGEVSFIRGIEIIEPSVRAPHKEGLRLLLAMEVP